MATDETYSVILAGGEGGRIRPMIQSWLGRHQPKQYCTFVGTRSMFQHTVDRADLLTPPERRITVIARGHRHVAAAQLAHRPRGLVVEQPVNCDTAAGIFLPLSYVRARNPHATVVIYPSDHFAYPESIFMECIDAAIRASAADESRIMLMGIVPRGTEPEYGWITPGPQRVTKEGQCLQAVASFVEKPGVERSRQLLGQGGLWNTFVFAANLDLLWNLGWQCFPEIMWPFETLVAKIGTPKERDVLEAIYRTMASRNFSADLIGRSTSHIAVIPIEGVFWSDWGKGERILETLRLIGREPTFPLECISQLPKVSAGVLLKDAF